jgi:CMP-N-acetylneuraminic acid synthetase
MRVLGLIPARAGSKRLPGKNLAPLGGKPLLAYTCEAAIESTAFDAVYLNTDSREIAGVGRQYGVLAPILRPSGLAQDDTTTEAATRFFLSYIAEHGDVFDAFVLLQPTSPLRSAQDIRDALSLYEENAPCAVVSAAPVAPANWLGCSTKDGQFERLPGAETLFRLNGAIYIYGFDAYLRGDAPPKTLLYPMPPERSVDIDTAADLRLAEHYLHEQHAVMYGPV